MALNLPLIRLSKSTVTTSDINSVSQCLREEFLGIGSYVQEFETKICSYGYQYAIATSSGTSSLQLALQAHGVGPGDEVVLPSLTYVATYQAVSATGATPISCDVRLSDLSLCPDSLLSLISNKTKAVIHVHFASLLGSLHEVRSLLRHHSIPLIEDAAHSFGDWSINHGNYDTICHSFDGIKNITCGEGGVVCTTNKHIADTISDLRLLAVSNDSVQRYKNARSWNFDVKSQGWRYHMSNINAALGLSQLQRIDSIRDKRRTLSNYYYQALLASQYFTPLLPLLNNDTLTIPHIYPVLAASQGFDTNSFRNFMLDNNIQTGLHYYPNHLLSYYLSSVKEPLPNTMAIYPQMVTLPLHLDLNYNDIDRIVETIDTYFKL
ncbi:DegT/DnrJ/EryC1/StrS aminotransferase family protein [Synechococcus sp. UW179A]|uniref:DegT/DnrJ/EryC1/StrS family aminotransferase n=1 Tax=Synechococcus sp. UW179A TaxID=2575510 RepID=UPI000E0E419F|nr:DegT/DnrJ/EryC1/StrS family aminotransferase [Synechococcus sp. UW179A]